MHPVTKIIFFSFLNVLRLRCCTCPNNYKIINVHHDVLTQMCAHIKLPRKQKIEKKNYENGDLRVRRDKGGAALNNRKYISSDATEFNSVIKRV